MRGALGSAAVLGILSLLLFDSLWLFDSLRLDFPASAQPVDEYEVKAAYLYHFAKLTEWPGTDRPLPGFSLCVSGEHPIAAHLPRLAGKVVKGAPITVRRLAAGEGWAGCRMVFVGECDGAVRDLTLGQGILTVSDCPGFAEAGGMVELRREGDRVRFGVNLPAARAAGLRFDPHLLKLGRSRPAETGSEPKP